MYWHLNRTWLFKLVINTANPKGLKGYLEGLIEGLVINSRFWYYSLFIIVLLLRSQNYVFIACQPFITHTFLLPKCIHLNHPQCLGIPNNILVCKGMCGISFFCLDRQQMAMFHSYSLFLLQNSVPENLQLDCSSWEPQEGNYFCYYRGGHRKRMFLKWMLQSR